ncbi:YncE family protein [Cytophaga hutchinsonii]|uniref:Surface layer protein n=1 Tax=Cytophaga hutchinsonii (strain ATCC 33406 / DSM 1761 / CIP 103989 / NBRC 15051 / NCIMB 9469 / D465) TaxID=269798 RepID=A0A6N4SR90_CYTH3|nr:DUF5074 domain-containing protein [Cytophaga hutchinsonii]ABG58879.1 conserved hypothetical protein; possible surface layer protein [Cytophaga hutchinsonii ATCC 33406]SFX81207.1 hypothetical protein SAMN04487930_11077 [Cytophaga hutchinsonii ATCC 33406]
MNRILSFIAFILLISSCKPPVRESDPLPDLLNTGIYIVNEGNFMSGNGSVSFYDSSTNTVTQDLFYLKNNKQAGDVCQSLSYYNNEFYLVVNNSGKIEIVDNDFVNTKTISGFTSPRYISFSANNKGYVSDLYGKGISVVDTRTHTINKKITINYWTEELLIFRDTLYVTSPNSRYLYLIDTHTDVLKDSVDIGFGSSSIAVDDNNKIWILCSGNKSLSIFPSICCLDPINREVVRNISGVNYDSYASKLNYNKVDKHMYWIEGDIYKLATNTSASVKEKVIDAAGKNFYGLGIRQQNGDVVVSDAGDFSQRSTIYIYTNAGIERTHFNAGIISGGFFIK